ncbi:hypothetical protein CAL7716_093900 [Calothrix sp. PCC 7716]|nr:hypothetical protein CAL7716_093900 [Calothrix sp. PCC 7716]
MKFNQSSSFQEKSSVLVFIDSKVQNYQSLISGIKAGAKAFILHPEFDGVEQITQTLSQFPNVESVHIISHGAPGTLYLGSTELSLDTLGGHTKKIKKWFNSASTLLIYGCNVAADAGTEFLEKLHLLTNANIYASSTAVGSSDLDGNWDLDVCYSKNTLDFPGLVFQPEVLVNYAGVFGTGADKYYTYYDSKEGAKGTVAFTDISTTGTLQTPAINQQTSAIALPFSFNFYGNTFNNVVIGENGGIGFRDSNTAQFLLTNSNIPSTDSRILNSLLPFWDDLDAQISGSNRTGKIYTKSDTDRFTVQWTNFKDEADNNITFQVVLYKGTNNIDFIYLTPNDGSTASIGLNKGTLEDGKAVGIAYSVDAPGLNGVTSIRFVTEPQLKTNNFPIQEGQTITLSPNYFNATDVDNSIDLSKITYTISNLLNGEFRLNSSIVTTFTQKDINDGKVQFIHDGGEIAPSFNISLSDGSNTSSAKAATVSFTKVNDSPVLTDSATSVDFNENALNAAAAIINSSNIIGLMDVDSTDFNTGNLTVSYSSGAAPQDQLSVSSGSNGITVSAENVSYNGTVFGSIDTTNNGASGKSLVVTFISSAATPTAVKALIQSLTYQNTSDIPNPSRTISITVNDGDGGTSAAISKVINVTAENDAPVNTVPTAQTINEDEILTFIGANLISVSDPDAVNNPVKVKLEATGGTLSLNGVGGLNFVGGAGDGLDDATLEFTGTLTNINAALNGMSFKPTANYNGAASVRIITDDLGNSGAGLTTPSDKIVNITVNAVNDAPVNTVPTAQTVKEDTNLVFNSANNNLIRVDDVDVNENPSGTVQVTLSVAKGILTLASTNGITFATGNTNDKPSITFTGKLIDVNNALNGLTYRGNENANGADKLTIITSDLGNVGSGSTKTDQKSIDITIDAVNDAPLNTVPSTQAVEEDKDLIFSTVKGNAITVSDVDVNEGTGELEVTLSVTKGTLTLADTTGLSFLAGSSNSKPSISVKGTLSAINKALDGLAYRGNLNYNGADTLSINTSDLGNKGEGGVLLDSKTVAINVTAVNDAPVNIVPGQQTVKEDENLVFNSANKNAISVSDIDIPVNAGDIQVVLSVTEGKLTLGQITGLNVQGNNTNSVTLKGTQTNINNALEGLTYLGNQDFNSDDILKIVTSDLANVGLGGELRKEDTVQIKITAVNDAPETIVPTSQSINEDTDLALTGANAIKVKDLDAGEGTGEVEVKLSVGKGILTLQKTDSLTFDATNGDGKSNVIFRGKIADINIALDSLVYRGNLNANGAETLTVTTSDLGNTGIGGVLTDTKSTQITINPVNDDPINTVPTQQTVDEDVKLVFDAANKNAISIVDVDAVEGTGRVEVKLSVGKGLLTLSNTSDLTFTEGDGVSDSKLTFTGTVDKINQALNGLLYLGNQDSNSIGNNDDTLTIITSDLGNTGIGGIKTDTDTVTIKRNAVNDAPVNTVPGNQSVDEDTNLALTGAKAIQIKDIDALEGTGIVEVKLSVDKGTLTLQSTTNLTFDTINGNGKSTVVFRGQVADINTALNTLVYRGNLNVNGADTLTVITNDLGNTGAGGALTDTDSFQITINPVNDAPVNTVPGAQTVNEDEDLIFSGAKNNLISIGDVDVNEGTGEVEVTLAVTKGVLTLKDTTGLTFAAGTTNGKPQMTVKGKVADINKALDGLVYRGNLNYNGNDTLTITTNDLGNTGSGGILKDVDTVQITLTPVNDPPVNAEIPGAQTINEDTSLIFNSANKNAIKISDVDVDGDQNGAVVDVQVTLAVTKGKLTLAQTTGLTFVEGTTNGSATVIVTGSVENINKAIDGLAYIGNQDFNGEDTLTVSINDKSNGGAGELFQKDSVKISVKPINDAPVNTVSNKQSVKEDTDLAFNAANGNSISINDVDANEGTGETEVKLSVTKGVLTLQDTTGLTFKEGNGKGNTVLSFTGNLIDINKALASLTYRGNDNYHGQDTLIITTNDKGNSGDGGILTDTDNIDITVTAVNDAPVNTVPQSQKVDEDEQLIFSAQTGNAISISDVDANEGTGEVEVTLAVSKGVLTLKQAAGLTFKTGDGKPNAKMTFTGKVEDINKALEGIIYQGNKDYSGEDSLTITTSDLGNFGSDIQIDTDTIGISIIPDTDADGINSPTEELVALEIAKQNPTDNYFKNLSQKASSDAGVVALFGQDGAKKPIVIAISEQDQKQLGGTSEKPALIVHSVTTQRFNDAISDPIAVFDSKDLKKSSLKKLAPVLDVINFGVMPNSAISEESLQQKIKDGIKQKPVRVEIKLPDEVDDLPVNTILKRKSDGTLYDFRRQVNPNRGNSDNDVLTGAVLQDRNLDGKADWAVVYLQDGEWGDSDGVVDVQIGNSLVGANWDLGTSRIEARSSQDGLNFYGNRSYVQFTLDSFSGVEASSVGMARVRFGADGQIIEVNGKSVKSLEEAKQAIIQRGETLFDNLSKKKNNPDIGNQTRTVTFEEGEQAVFFIVKGTKDELLFSGLNSKPVEFSLSSLNNGAAMMTASNDESGQTAKLSLAKLFNVSAKVLTAEEARPQLGLFAVGQNQAQLKTTDELIDLKSSGAFDSKQVKLSLSLQREALHNNTAYLFRVDDASGSIRDPLTGMLLDPTEGLSAEQKQRYLELATTERLIQGTELQTPNQQTREISVNLTGGEYYVPFLVSNGTLSSINKDFSRILTPYLGINSNGVDHIRSLGNNKFGFEDIIGGGDRDYNDMILSIKQVQIMG